MSKTNPCGCACTCHRDEGNLDWPGPCAGCCEPGDMCDCGPVLEALGFERAIMPTEFTRPGYGDPEPEED